MANTYSQIYIHFVFAVQNRTCCIQHHWKAEVFQYISAIVQQQEHVLYAINGMPDHIHALVSMNLKQSPSDLMHHVKRSSSLWINDNNWSLENFHGKKGLVRLATESPRFQK